MAVKEQEREIARRIDDIEGALPYRLDNDFAEYIGPGMNIALVGGKGTGKSWTASYLSSLALKRPDYYVASNILCHTWTSSEDGLYQEDQAYPDGYFKTTSYFDLFGVIYLALKESVEQLRRGEIRNLNEGRKVLFVLDEAGALAKGFQAGETSLQAHVRDNKAFMSVSRHVNVCALFLTQSLELLGTSFRTTETGLLDLIITKVPDYPGYDPNEVVRIEDAYEGIAHARIPSFGLAHDTEWAMATPGTIVYSDSVAAFDRGKYPRTNISFRLRELLDSISGQLPSKYPEIIRYHLDNPPILAAPIKPQEGAPPPPDAKKVDAEADEARRRGEVTAYARPLLEQGTSVTTVHKMTVAALGHGSLSMIYKVRDLIAADAEKGA